MLLADWKQAVVPGLYFLTVEPSLAVYGKILRLQQEGYIWAVCYHNLCYFGEESKLHRSELTIPLSVWQFTLARQKGWPSTDDGLTEILTTPPD
jgi:hypothetical protein